MTEENSLEHFRSLLEQQYWNKGISPPEPGSPREAELYATWLKGKKSLSNDAN